MSVRLNQIVAVEKSVKSRATRDLTDIYHRLEKKQLLSGISRTYQPIEEDGEQLPAETARVQVRVEEEIRRMSDVMTELFDVTATKDWGNMSAVADVKVDGKVVLAKVPVTYLLFLEKQLTDLHTVARSLPVLDESQEWEDDPAQNCYRSAPVETARTKKVPRAFVKAEATDKHPAQVEVVHEDIRVGTWRKVDFSGALSQRRATQILDRIVALQKAVKVAREEANDLEVTEQRIGDAVFGYLFGKNGAA